MNKNGSQRIYHKGFCLAILGLWSTLGWSQEVQRYPNLPPPPVVLENEHVVVQTMPTVTSWAGIHTHSGKQLAVVIQPFSMTYRIGTEEKTVEYEAGDVFWIDAETHDHRALEVGQILLISIK